MNVFRLGIFPSISGKGGTTVVFILCRILCLFEYYILRSAPILYSDLYDSSLMANLCKIMRNSFSVA